MLFIFVVYFGFVHVARILFHRTADFSDLMRSADMVMGFCAGMYTSTDLRRVHHFRKYSKQVKSHLTPQGQLSLQGTFGV